MPLHDWDEQQGWDGVHQLWIVELLLCIKPQLPAGYRAYIGTMPTLAVGVPTARPDVVVLQWSSDLDAPGNGVGAAGGASDEPVEQIALATLDPGTSLFVELKGNLIAAV